MWWENLLSQQIKTKGLPKLQDISSRLNVQKCVHVYSRTTACQYLAFNNLKKLNKPFEANAVQQAHQVNSRPEGVPFLILVITYTNPATL